MKKMSKVGSIVFLIVMLALTACSGGNGKSSGKSAARVDITLSAGIETPEEGIYYETLKYLKDELPKQTDNQIKLDIYPNQQLGNEVSMLEGLRSGSVDVTITGIGNFSNFVKEFQVFSLPYIFKTYEVYRQAMEPSSDVWALMKEKVEKAGIGITLAAPSTVGSRWVVNTKGEVKTPEDMAKLNLKIRVQASPIESEVWSGYGAHPVTMPMPEVYAAMKQGVVDAVENAPSVLYTNKIQEVAKYFSETDHSFYVALVSISNATLDKIPEQLRPVVLEVFEKAGQHALDVSQTMHADYVKQLRDSGVTITTVDKESFSGQLLPLHQRIAEEVGATDILQAIGNLK